ncbi:MAG TPA: hypothetical protein VFQ38_07545 [Longimicrobiales bacterium]|nr:hypothetical protein [Longimicrobiales bacterium]
MTLAAMAATVAFAATPALAQQTAGAGNEGTPAPSAPKPDSATEAASKAKNTAPKIVIQHVRPADQRGVEMFEAPKDDGVAYDGFKLDWGAAFSQQFQSLSHSNTAAVKTATDASGKPYNANQLIDIGPGFVNAMANLYTNVQIAPGIRVALETYLSTHHHQEAWVKDGYIQIDASPIDVKALNELMKVVTLKVGHMEINFGDAHFRRADGGQSLYNPFVGNLLLDAYTTEIGAELYARKGPFLAMGGVTGGEIHGEVTQPAKRSPALYAKVGFDKQLTPELRVRLTGSGFTQDRSLSNTLYHGDRAGSRYQLVMENMAATTTANAWSGNINPGFGSQVKATMINPFVKYRGLEVFGTIENAKGKGATETATRSWKQYDADVVYRFLPSEKAFVGGRWNTAKGQLAGIANDVTVDHLAASAGWFVTPNLLLKGEYVTQKYKDFPTTDIRNGGKFNGFVMEGVVAF